MSKRQKGKNKSPCTSVTSYRYRVKSIIVTSSITKYIFYTSYATSLKVPVHMTMMTATKSQTNGEGSRRMKRERGEEENAKNARTVLLPKYVSYPVTPPEIWALEQSEFV